MKTQTIKHKELTASDITKSALKELDLRGVECWRNNNVRAVRGRTFTGRKGVSDILGFMRATGVLLVCEVKTLGDTLSEAQKEFLGHVKRSGAIALIARQKGGEVVIEPYEE